MIGTFGGLTSSNLPSNFTANLTTDATHGYLNLALNVTALSGLNVNQANVAAALANSFNTTGGIPMVFGALTPAGLTRVSGELATGTQQATFNVMTQFMGVMTDPFVAGRGEEAAPPILLRRRKQSHAQRPCDPDG